MEEHSAFIIRFKQIRTLPGLLNLGPGPLTLKMKALCSVETSVNIKRPARRNIAEYTSILYKITSHKGEETDLFNLIFLDILHTK
jgi:hypothetical protein